MLAWDKSGKSHISLDDCVDGYTYHITARNANIGIFSSNPKEQYLDSLGFQAGFIINRLKFDKRFAFVEHHWDNGPPYGTTQPFKILEKAPNLDGEQVILDYLLEAERRFDIKRLELEKLIEFQIKVILPHKRFDGYPDLLEKYKEIYPDEANRTSR